MVMSPSILLKFGTETGEGRETRPFFKVGRGAVDACEEGICPANNASTTDGQHTSLCADIKPGVIRVLQGSGA